MKRILAALIVLACLAVGCAVRFRGQELLVLDPMADIWVRHPHAVTNAEPFLAP